MPKQVGLFSCLFNLGFGVFGHLETLHGGFRKGQLIWKGLFPVSFAPKNKRKYFSISALQIYCSKIILSFDFHEFLVQMKTAKKSFGN